jgi:hypothetical protein
MQLLLLLLLPPPPPLQHALILKLKLVECARKGKLVDYKRGGQAQDRTGFDDCCK